MSSYDQLGNAKKQKKLLKMQFAIVSVTKALTLIIERRFHDEKIFIAAVCVGFDINQR